jgi:CubicO group peptidase (beta-lactamase class C family)
MKKLLFILLQCVACAMPAQNNDQNQATNAPSSLFKDKAETEKWLLKNNIPALGIGYIRDGKIQDINVFGELEKGKPAPKNAIFNVASLTKPVTAMVTLKLVSEGKWDLDEPLANHWIDPDVADDPRAKTLTTRHILSHQTGFSNWRWNNKSKKLAFDFTPGTQYQYSGEGLEYLRKALENKFKRSLEDLANELIFKPLQMNDTRFTWDSTLVDESRFAKWHDKKGERYPTDKRTKANAADDLLTTVEDYSKFMLYVMNGAGLSDSTYKELITNQVKVKKNKYFGLGWSIDRPNGTEEFILTHDGSDRGVKTIAIMLPKSKQGLVIFTNSDNGVDAYIPVILAYLGKLGQDFIDVETK